MRVWLVFGVLGAIPAWSQAAPDGAAVFAKHCAACHRVDGPARAPLPEVLKAMSRGEILAALETGKMKTQGDALSPAERQAVAAYLGTAAKAPAESSGFRCAGEAPPLANLEGWNGWGNDLENTRYLPASLDFSRLKVKWAFGFPNSPAAWGQPAAVGGRLFFGSGNGTVYAVDARSGCTWWTFKAAGRVRAAVSVGPLGGGRYAAYFGDAKANVYAVDARNGELIWQAQAEAHPNAVVTGAPKLDAGRLYVPVSSLGQEMAADNPKFSCCSFRGSVMALDAATGRKIWQAYSIPAPPRPVRVNAAGTQLYGPSGAAVWSSPTIDTRRGLIYVGTGNNYSEPDTPYSDAILAFELESGKLRWSRQMTPRDGWNAACIPMRNGASCPPGHGDDLDFGSSPILRRAGERDVLVVAQKSGVVYALDPDDGRTIWEVRVGKGGPLGGVEWGPAADEQTVYVPVSDVTYGKAAGGLYALKLASGEKVWYAPPPAPPCAGRPGCSPAQMAPATALAGAVLSGSLDGHLRAYDVRDGHVLWDLDTLREFPTVNGVKARGGSLNASGPVAAGGMLFVNSGYGILGGMPGNVLLALGTE